MRQIKKEGILTDKQIIRAKAYQLNYKARVSIMMEETEFNPNPPGVQIRGLPYVWEGHEWKWFCNEYLKQEL